MRTDKLWINGRIRRNCEINDMLRPFAGRAGINGKDFSHMNLLTEETIGMVNHDLNDFDGEIWLETTPAGYDIILEAAVRESGSCILSDASAGFMAKIAEKMNCSYMFSGVSEMPENLAAALPDCLSYGNREARDTMAWAGKWSLSAYRRNPGSSPATAADPDELEKTILASLADEVTIGILGHRIRLVISKS